MSKHPHVSFTEVRQYSSRPAAFTLIELLVVISIISLLVAILLPALAKARSVAVQLQCLTQMRSLTQYLAFYSTDNDGYSVDYYTRYIGNEWVDEAITSGNRSTTGYGSKLAIMNYIPTGSWNESGVPTTSNGASMRNLLTCPAEPGMSSIGYGHFALSYRPNHLLMGLFPFGSNKYARMSRLDVVSKPSDLFLFIESNMNPAATDAYIPRPIGQRLDWYDLRNRPDAYRILPADNYGFFSHDANGNIMFVDGHGELRHSRAVAIATDTSIPGGGSGEATSENWTPNSDAMIVRR